MKRFGAITATLILTLWFANTALADHRSDEVVVRFRENTTAGDQQRMLDENGAHIAGEIPAQRVKKIKLPPGLTVEKAIERLKKHSGVEMAEPNYLIHKALVPDDYGLVGNQWGLAKIGAVQSWTMTLSGINDATVVVAILDTGILSTHAEMIGQLVPGTNIISPGTPPEDDEFHGTFVAGVVAAHTNNGIGMAGVAWKAKLMPVKILAADGSGDEFGMVSGLNWAVAHGARVINMSLGSCSGGVCRPGTQYAADAMVSAWNNGAVLIAATGNEGMQAVSYPASYPYVVGVGATDNGDNRATYSNYGGMVDLAAPGGGCAAVYDPTVDIFSCAIPASTYATACGTSAAAPFVSGLAAVILGQNPNLTNEDVVRIMESTADPVGGSGWNQYTGYGRINMYRALAGAETAAPADNISAYNYPNPFSPRMDHNTSFVVRNLGGRALSMEIRDVLGNILYSKSFTAGEAAGMDFYFDSRLRWDGRDKGGRMVPNGVYFALVKAGSSRTTVKVVVIH